MQAPLARLPWYHHLALLAKVEHPELREQLGLYMAVVDDVLAKDGDKPTIGLLLCRNKNQVVAEYALKGFKAPMGVAEWTSAINRSLPAEFRSALPSVDVLEAELTAGD